MCKARIKKGRWHPTHWNQELWHKALFFLLNNMKLLNQCCIQYIKGKNRNVFVLIILNLLENNCKFLKAYMRNKVGLVRGKTASVAHTNTHGVSQTRMHALINPLDPKPRWSMQASSNTLNVTLRYKRTTHLSTYTIIHTATPTYKVSTCCTNTCTQTPSSSPSTSICYRHITSRPWVMEKWARRASGLKKK